MAVRERLNQNISRDLDEELDDLDLAYIEQLRESGIDEELIKQFISLGKASRGSEE